MFATGFQIEGAHAPYKWIYLATYNAEVIVVIVGISAQPRTPRRLFSLDEHNKTVEKRCEQINAYLVAGKKFLVQSTAYPMSGRGGRCFCYKPVEGRSVHSTKSHPKA